MATVFISYKSENEKSAKNLVTALERRGVDCWIAYRNIPAGIQYDDAIPNAISTCDAVVMILDQESMNSKHLKNELRIAVECDKSIIPFMLENVMLKEAFLYHMSANSRIFAHKNWDEGVDALLASLNELCHSPENEAANEIIRTLQELNIQCPKCRSKNYYLRLDGLERLMSTAEGQNKRERGRRDAFALCGAGVIMAVPIFLFLARGENIPDADRSSMVVTLGFCTVLIMASITIAHLLKQVEWIYEVRRRYRVRKHIEAYHLTCSECCHKFKKVIKPDSMLQKMGRKAKILYMLFKEEALHLKFLMLLIAVQIAVTLVVLVALTKVGENIHALLCNMLGPFTNIVILVIMAIMVVVVGVVLLAIIHHDKISD